MKVWVKLVAGSLLGLLLGILLPAANPAVSEAFAFLAKVAIAMGRYTAVALILFSLIMGIYELRQERRFWKFILCSMAAIVLVSIVVIASGMLVTAFFPPERVPILTEQSAERVQLDTKSFLLEIFPSNMLSVLVGNGVYLFPICIFAFFIALGLAFKKTYTQNIMSIIDALSRIFYYIAEFFSEILGLLVIALAAYWAMRYQTVQSLGVFATIIRLLLVFTLLLGVAVLPLFLFLVKKYKTPWKVVFASLGSAISAFFSGDINFCLPVFLQQSKESLGIRRRANTLGMMLWTTFGRSGSAMVAAASLLVIIKSYSSLGVRAEDFLSIGLYALIISFFLARNPGDGAFVALAVLCSSYGHGFETGYLILKPIAFYLISMGAFLDIMIASIGCFAVARLSGFQIDRDMKNFM